jgi:hypothetical protein
MTELNVLQEYGLLLNVSPNQDNVLAVLRVIRTLLQSSMYGFGMSQQATVNLAFKFGNMTPDESSIEWVDLEYHLQSYLRLMSLRQSQGYLVRRNPVYGSPQLWVLF